MITLRILPPGAALSLVFILGTSALSGHEEEPPRVPGTPPALTLSVKTGQDFIFHATDEAGKRKMDYRVVVQDVAAEGDITLAVVGFHQRADDETFSLARAKAHGTILALSREGRVKQIAEEPAISREFEAYLRLVFGSGIHARPLEERRVYPLEPLLASTANFESIHLRFEGFLVEEERELARFTVVEGQGESDEPGREPPHAPRNLRVVEAEGATPSVTPAVTVLEPASVAVFPRKWTTVGEATYRTADGVLEAARLEGLSADQRTIDPKLAKLYIRRVSIGRKGKPSAGSDGRLGVR